jgi:hypothetical protein
MEKFAELETKILVRRGMGRGLGRHEYIADQGQNHDQQQQFAIARVDSAAALYILESTRAISPTIIIIHVDERVQRYPSF